jgi:hypothetical protein
MKFHAIFPNNKDDFYGKTLVNHLLQKGIFNDHYFEHVMFNIIVEPDSWQDFLFRYLWESVYLRRSSSEQSVPCYKNKITKNSDSCLLKVSLAELLEFITVATPPSLKHLIPDSTKNVKNIMDVIKEFLFKENGGQKQLYHSMFKKVLRMELFGTKKTYDVKRMDSLREYNPNLKDDVDITIDVESATSDIFNHFFILDKGNFGMQITIQFINDTQIKYLLSHDLLKTFDITNVYLIKKNLYVSMYTLNYIPNDAINKIIKHSYSSLGA